MFKSESLPQLGWKQCTGKKDTFKENQEEKKTGKLQRQFTENEDNDPHESHYCDEATQTNQAKYEKYARVLAQLLMLICCVSIVQRRVQAPRFIMPLLYSLASFITFISHSFDGGTKVSCLALHINHVQHWYTELHQHHIYITLFSL